MGKIFWFGTSHFLSSICYSESRREEIAAQASPLAPFLFTFFAKGWVTAPSSVHAELFARLRAS
jgi:hypothetical protein